MEYSESHKLIKNSLISFFGIFAAYKTTTFIFNYYKSYQKRKTIDALIKKYKLEREDQIKKFLSKYSDFLSENKKNKILKLKTCTSLTSAIKSGELTVKETTIYFLLRAVTIGEEHNFLADINLEETVVLAEEMDRKFNENEVNDGEILGIEKDGDLPLLGVPFSVKENIHLKGFATTFAYCKNIKNISQSNAYLVDVLIGKGAIPIVKSNVPQGFMSYDSSNNIWGFAKNPYNKDHSAGGSSGGEAGLVSTGCCLFGIGSDLAGSIRIPAFNCGVYGIKPTSTRISKYGSIGIDGGYFYTTPLISSSYGPIAGNIEDLALISKELFGNFEKIVYE